MMSQPANSDVEKRVSSLVGDRLCTHCAYNLTGQPVIREPHYKMLIVRCPECSAVASVQEYPLLGRWANRWAAMLSGLWFLVLMILWIGNGAAIFGMAIGAAEWSAEAYRSKVREEFNVWQAEIQQLQQQQAASAVAPRPGTTIVTDFDSWWKSQNTSDLLKAMGGWRNAIEWRALIVWIPLGLVSFIFGCVWSAALLGRGRGGLLIWSAVIMTVAIAFSVLVASDWLNDEGRRYWRVGYREIGVSMLLASLLFAWLMLTAGLMLGRKTIRGALTFMLPPRLRSPLAMLWTVDGLVPPTTRR